MSSDNPEPVEIPPRKVIMSKPSRTIFVFGSNREGRHGKGAAREAVEKHGAIYGRAEGIQGNSYAIVTKELRGNWPAVTVENVATGVTRLLAYARLNPSLQFEVTPIGCGLAGFTPQEIAPLFKKRPDNVILPPEFLAVLEETAITN